MWLEYYGLNPCHYFTSPGLSWDAMLKLTRIKLELISDCKMHLMIEEVMRGGISYIAKRFSNANNKYIKSSNNSKPSVYIYIYIYIYIYHLFVCKSFIRLGNEPVFPFLWI